jgi:chromate transporter
VNQPTSVSALFVAFSRLALQGFGGVLAVAQRELVERLGWLSKDEFVELLATAQALPGPNVVNLSMMIGDRYFGLRGALAALAGMLVLPSALVLMAAALLAHLTAETWVQDALRGMGMVSAGLILATGLKLLPTLRTHPLGRPLALALAVLGFGAVVLLHLPLVAVIGVLGPIGIALAWQRLPP